MTVSFWTFSIARCYQNTKECEGSIAGTGAVWGDGGYLMCWVRQTQLSLRILFKQLYLTGCAFVWWTEAKPMSETHRVTCKIGSSRSGVAEHSSLLYCCAAVSTGSHLPTFRNVGRCEPVDTHGGTTHRTGTFHTTACAASHTDPSLEIGLLITFHSHILFTQCNSHVIPWLILIVLLFPNERHTCGWFRTNQPDNLLSITVSFRLGWLCSSLYVHNRPTARTHTHTHTRHKYANYNLGYFNLCFQIADKEAKHYRTAGSQCHLTSSNVI
jgi:hypothetical protein